MVGGPSAVVAADTHDVRDDAPAGETSVQALVRDNLTLPTIPAVAAKALEELSNQNATAASLAAIFSHDQGLSARVLRVSNSAMFATTRKVSSVAHAAAMLGFQSLKSIVLAVSGRMIYKRFGPLEEAMWRHSVTAAIVAATTAKRIGERRPDEPFLAGLMHDVGKVAMNNADPKRFRKAVDLCTSEFVPSYKAEQHVYAFTHVDVGVELLTEWGMSSDVIEAVRYHHVEGPLPEFEASTKRLVHLVRWCDAAAHALDEPETPEALTGHPSLALLGIEAAEVEGLMQEIRDAHAREAALFH